MFNIGMRISDRPGRYFAMIVFSPYLMFVGQIIKHDFYGHHIAISVLSGILFFYELFWITRKKKYEFAEI